MTAYRTGECRSCHQPVVWAVTPAGKRMPVDPDPVVQGAGNIRLTPGAPDPTAVVLSGADFAAADEACEPLYLSHFATCPQGKSWRRGK